MSGRTHVFAYGSNLSRRRLELRVGPVTVVGAGCLAGHTLRFHKIGKDGSAKADALSTGQHDDGVWGVVYTLDARAKRSLDHFEGLGRGYTEREAVVRTTDAEIASRVYHALPACIDPALLPFDWYLDWVIAGAREHGLPASYVEKLAAQPVVEDPDRERARRERLAQLS
jgi:gamma-glutamylcyclotransferase